MTMERDALMREVDEELRREQFKKLWAQYGTYIIGAALAVLVGIGGYKWWEGSKIATAEHAGQQFEEALDLASAGKLDDAGKLLQTIGSSASGSYAALAQLALAGQAAKEGKTDAAVTAFDAAAANSSDQLVKDFARLQSMSLKIDSADFTDVQNRLNDLIGDTNPWRYLARELLGVAALRSGKLDEARSVLAPLSADPRAPNDMRERAGALMNLVVSAELARTAPGKVELEKVAEPAPVKQAPAPVKEPPRGKSAPPKGGAAKSK